LKGRPNGDRGNKTVKDRETNQRILQGVRICCPEELVAVTNLRRVDDANYAQPGYAANVLIEVFYFQRTGKGFVPGG